MSKNVQNPAATNPSRADLSGFEPALSTWKLYNHILFIIKNLPTGTYEQAIQDKFQEIKQRCSDMCGNDTLMANMNPITAADLIEPLAEQLQASPCWQVASLAQQIMNQCKDIENIYSS